MVWNDSVCSAAHCCAPVNHVPPFWDDSLLYRAEMSGGEGMRSSAAGILMVLTVPVAYPWWFWKLPVLPFLLHVHHLTPEMSHVSPTLLTVIFAPCSHNYMFFIFPSLHKLQPEVYPCLCVLYLLHLYTTHLSLCTLGAFTFHLKFSCSTATHCHSPEQRAWFLPLAGTVPAAGENQLASEGWAASFHFHMRLKQEQQQL